MEVEEPLLVALQVERVGSAGSLFVRTLEGGAEACSLGKLGCW